MKRLHVTYPGAEFVSYLVFMVRGKVGVYTMFILHIWDKFP